MRKDGTMNIYLWATKKRNNSTLQPSNGRSVYVHLKESCTVEAPVFILKLEKMLSDKEEDNQIINNYNYLYAPAFRRYYWIVSKKILDGERMEISCAIDVLATYKPDIEKTYLLFERTPTPQSGMEENAIPLLNFVNTDNRNSYAMYEDNEIYVYIDVAGRSEGGVNPTTTTYMTSFGAVKRLMAKVFDATTYATEGMGQATMDLIQQTICNPSQYIVSCRVGRIKSTGVARNYVMLGWTKIEIGETAFYVLDNKRTHTIEKTVAFNGYNSMGMGYEYQLYIPTIGYMSIPKQYAGSNLTVKYVVDMSSGKCYCTVKKGNYVIEARTGTALFQMPLSGVVASISVGGAMQGLIGGGTAVVDKGKDVLQGLWNAAIGMPTGEKMWESVSDIKSTTLNSAVERNVKTIGGSESLAELLTENNITTTTIIPTRTVSAENTALVMGYPHVARVRMIDSGKGYYRALYADVPIYGTQDEKQSLATFLKSGIFYE